MKKIIHNGIVVDSEKLSPLDILIEDGKITKLLPRVDKAELEADEIIDAKGMYILPGLIDAHLHPVYADRIDTISKASLRSGITCLIPYIGAVSAWGQNSGLKEAILSYIEEGEKNSVLDFSIHCTLTQNSIQEAKTAISELFDLGVISFKAFTSYRKRGMQLDDEEIIEIMVEVAKKGGILAFHAENGALVEFLETQAQELGNHHPRYYPATHPNLSEAEAIFRVLSLAAHTNCGIYLPHVTCHESLEVIKLFKKWNCVNPLYVETCPHYLTLTDEELEKQGNLAKMSPPLRKEEDKQALWKAVADKSIDVIASDAAGHTIEKNSPIFENTFTAPHGAPGVDTLVSMTWNEGINKGHITVHDIVRVMSENPAKIFGLYPQKGCIQPGADADLILFDANSSFTQEKRNPLLNVDYSLFADVPCLGQHKLIMLRGEVVFENGELSQSLPKGRFLAGKVK